MQQTYVLKIQPFQEEERMFSTQLFSGRRGVMFLLVAFIVTLLGFQSVCAATMDTIGNVRVSCLSAILVRIEAKTSAGNFEDRPTLMVVQRNWPNVTRTKTTGATTTITTTNYTVTVPNNGTAITGCAVTSGGQAVFTYNALPSGRTNFPAPDELGLGYVIADAPRVVQPAWGATPMPAGALPTTDPLYATSGWDYRYTATADVYVFVNTRRSFFGDYVAVRTDFLRLSGPIPIVPLYFLGFVNSRYQAITQAYAIQHADMFRNTYRIPIDIYVIDTDWRTGAYDYNPTYFPNPVQFFTDMHTRHFKITFNDHPQGTGTDYQTRWNGLTPKMNDGLDFWWFDRNWSGIITSPVTGIDQEMWGNKLFWDIQKRFLEQKTGKKMRPALYGMRSNDPANGVVDPINQPHPGAHRNPGWWSGDQYSTWEMLTKGIAASVADGTRLLPHVQHDIAGHRTADPGDDLYTRWMQFGAFSPQPRIHVTNFGEGVSRRYPWEFTTDTRLIVTRYLELRYRLMPMMYTALRKCFEDGSPLLQRCDLFWPATAYAAAKNNYQYLFGDDILIRPVITAGSTMTTTVNTSTWIPPGFWVNAWTGQILTGPQTLTVASQSWHEPLFIRRGSVIVMCDTMQYTSQKPWNPLTLEVYPPATDSPAVTRTLYEDDDSTYNYDTLSQYRKTSITATRTSATNMQVVVNPAQGTFPGMLANRGWIVRLHTDAARTTEQVRVNGALVTIGTAWTKGAQAQARLFNATAFPGTITSSNFPIPLQGEGQAAGPNAPGPVVEVWVPTAATTSTQTVEYGIITGIQSIVSQQQLGDRLTVRSMAGGQLQVRFAVPSLQENQALHHVKVTLYNLKGKAVRTLVDEKYASRDYTVTVDAAGNKTLPAGAYLCKLSIDGTIHGMTTVSLIR
jgi:hypothetical protein